MANPAAGRARLKPPSVRRLDALWRRHADEWRQPAQIASQWQEAATTDRALLRYATQGEWWDVLGAHGITLLVTREYEHLVMGLSVDERHGPIVSFSRLPHPSGIAVDRPRGVVHIASTRNPNQVYDLAPVTGLMPRLDLAPTATLPVPRPLVPIRSRFYPGSLYLHDLALVGGVLHGNAVGRNSVVRLDDGGGFEDAWWPRCVEVKGRPVTGQNHIQLNSIAAGRNLKASYFSASSDQLSERRPTHRNFSVDKRGVIFSGVTREVLARGLTRPHSARLRQGRLWVDNSGYGELGIIRDGGFTPALRLPGWTRGLCFHQGVAFVGTSRVIPRFRRFAPGLDVDRSVCGIHAVEVRSGQVLGSLTWPTGNQVFAIEWLPKKMTSGLPFKATGRRSSPEERDLFYAFAMTP